jgi:hypothetical protein
MYFLEIKEDQKNNSNKITLLSVYDLIKKESYTYTLNNKDYFNRILKHNKNKKFDYHPNNKISINQYIFLVLLETNELKFSEYSKKELLQSFNLDEWVI